MFTRKNAERKQASKTSTPFIFNLNQLISKLEREACLSNKSLIVKANLENLQEPHEIRSIMELFDYKTEVYKNLERKLSAVS